MLAAYLISIFPSLSLTEPWMEDRNKEKWHSKSQERCDIWSKLIMTPMFHIFQNALYWQQSCNPVLDHETRRNLGKQTHGKTDIASIILSLFLPWKRMWWLELQHPHCGHEAETKKSCSDTSPNIIESLRATAVYLSFSCNKDNHPFV